MKKPRGKQVLLISYLSFACLISCLGAAIRPTAQAVEAPLIPDESPPATEVSADSAGIYLLRETEGKIGLFDNKGVLLLTLDIALASLPTADRELLRIGIPITTREELQALIQDFEG